MKDDIKRSICWNITSKCNENCKFCYRMINKIENDFYKNKEILELLKKKNISKISWTGGEPLLYPDFIELLKLSKSMGINNKLLTNGKLLTKEKITELEPYLDSITLPYDSNNPRTHAIMGRGKEHGEKVIRILDYIKENELNINIDINTIVTEVNKEEIIDIGNTLEKYKIGRWKLFKFMPLRNTAISNNNMFKIKDKEFDEIIEKVKKTYNKKIKIVKCKEDEIQSNYLLIDSTGTFIITEKLKDKKILI